MGYGQAVNGLKAAVRSAFTSRIGRTVERLGFAQSLFKAYERILSWRAADLPEQGADGLPLPPAHLQILVSGAATPRFEEKGAETALTIRRISRRTGRDINACRAVLDFGVGCGRIARHWVTLTGPAWYGCDYNPELVRWCQDNLPFLRTIQNELEPPLPYPDDTFDLIYAYSVFTHLTEPQQYRWMDELVRVLEPDGRIIFTTHGDATRRTMEPTLAAAYDRGELAVRFASGAGSNLCSTFHPQAWVRRKLLSNLTLLDFLPASSLGAQDFWVVQPISSPVVERPTQVPAGRERTASRRR
jgi:SAM-dependent methyltransferase